jgi:flagellin-like hook-associated protein FlgL
MEAGVVNAISFLEAQSSVFQRMSDAVVRMNQLMSQMSDSTKSDTERGNYFKEIQQLKAEMSSYRSAQFNGKNLLNYETGSTAETLTVAFGEDGLDSAGISQSDLLRTSEDIRAGALANQGSYSYFTQLLGQIPVVQNLPEDDGLGVTETSVGDENDWGQVGFDRLIQDIADRVAVNSSEQASLRLGLDRIRERMRSVDDAANRVDSVDVAQELSALTQNDMRLQGALASKTQSNVLADSALKLLFNADFPSPLIQEARLSAPSAAALIG